MKKSFILLCLLLTGCYPQKTGPYALTEDSVQYNQAVQNSVDSQLLLNVVRLRYRDTPTFLQVGLISSSYENSCGFGADFKLDSLNKANAAVSITPKISVDRKEKPTTTFQPVRGQGFVEEFLSPISIQSMVLLNSSGWSIERIMRCCVQRLNEISNAPTASGPTPKYAPNYEQFLELCEYFADLERNDAIDMVLGKTGKKDDITVYLAIEKDLANPHALQRIWELLDVEAGTYYIPLIPYHGKRTEKNQVILDARSPLSLLYFLSHGVRVPETDKMLGKVTLTQGDQGQEFDWNQVLDRVLTVHSGPVPCSASPSSIVYYRGTFFYIDDSDLESKSTFNMLSQLLALQFSCPKLPVTAFTIPLTN